jgi:HSP20 family molecular chaperone IbpA
MSFGKHGEGIKDWTRRIHDIMDEMRNRSFCDYRATGTWEPALNLYESREAYYVCVELAGLSPDAVVVECCDPKRVRVRGQRGQPRGPGQPAPFSVEVMEIDEGPFHREIDLHDPVEVQSVEVCYDKGYLWVTLRKTATT